MSCLPFTCVPVGPSNVAAMAQFFAANVDERYISHGELFCGRATDAGTWADGLEAVVQAELERIVRTPSAQHALMLMADGACIGLAVYSLDAEVHLAVLEDLVITQANRHTGIGQAFLADWERNVKAQGVKHAFLESGRMNVAAHAFFEKQGYAPISTTFMKTI